MGTEASLNFKNLRKIMHEIDSARTLADKSYIKRFANQICDWLDAINDNYVSTKSLGLKPAEIVKVKCYLDKAISVVYIDKNTQNKIASKAVRFNRTAGYEFLVKFILEKFEEVDDSSKKKSENFKILQDCTKEIKINRKTQNQEKINAAAVKFYSILVAINGLHEYVGKFDVEPNEVVEIKVLIDEILTLDYVYESIQLKIATEAAKFSRMAGENYFIEDAISESLKSSTSSLQAN